MFLMSFGTHRSTYQRLSIPSMNNNLFAGLIIVAVLVIAGIAIAAYSSGGEFSNTATSTQTAASGVLTGTVVGTTTQAAAAGAPAAVTQAATAVASTTATLHGLVNPRGSLTTYWFEYSSDPLLGAVLIRATPQVALRASSTLAQVEVDVAGLTMSTTYYYRLVANNEKGTTRGERMSFRTK